MNKAHFMVSRVSIVTSVRLFASIAAMGILVFSQTHAMAEEPAADAKELYHQYCSVCHGDRGDGRSRARQGLVPPPLDFTAPAVAQTLPRERMVESILNGRPGTAMVAWKTRVTREQAEAIADFIRSQFMGGSVSATSVAKLSSDSARVPRKEILPRGNASAGKALYVANCATCHGMKGDGAGPRAYFISPRPRDFTAAAARERLDTVTLFHAVKDGVRGREMPAWGKVLSDRQIADVSRYVTQAFLRPPPR